MPTKPSCYYFNKCEESLGSLCDGAMLGIRMALLGSKQVGIDVSLKTGRNNLFVFVETDRCIPDAISVVTGCRLGNRTLKFLDYGVSAATFLNIKTNEAARVVVKDTAEEYVEKNILKSDKSYEMRKFAYRVMSDDMLFTVKCGVSVNLDFYDLPGLTKKRVACDSCGVTVNDNRQVVLNKNIYCKPCHIAECWKPDHAMFVIYRNENQ